MIVKSSMSRLKFIIVVPLVVVRVAVDGDRLDERFLTLLVCWWLVVHIQPALIDVFKEVWVKLYPTGAGVEPLFNGEPPRIIPLF